MFPFFTHTLSPTLAQRSTLSSYQSETKQNLFVVRVSTTYCPRVIQMCVKCEMRSFLKVQKKK